MINYPVRNSITTSSERKLGLISYTMIDITGVCGGGGGGGSQRAHALGPPLHYK